MLGAYERKEMRNGGASLTAPAREKCQKHGVKLAWVYESCSCFHGEVEGEWDEPKWVKCIHCDGRGERDFQVCEICDEEGYGY